MKTCILTEVWLENGKDWDCIEQMKSHSKNAAEMFWNNLFWPFVLLHPLCVAFLFSCPLEILVLYYTVLWRFLSVVWICKVLYSLLLLVGRDIIGLAETGSGKTGAFALPILQALLETPQRLFALVLTPTRELAFQISEQFEALGSSIGVHTSK